MKKLIVLILTFAILLCMCPVFTFAISEEILILGDAEMDKKVNIKDATAIQKYAAHLIEFDEDNFLCADCNNDSKVNVKDATWVQKYLAKIECPYPIGKEITYSESETTPPITSTEVTETTTVPVTETAEPSEVLTTANVTSVSTDATETTPAESTTATETPATSITTDPIEPTTESEPQTMPSYNPVKPDTNITIYFSNNVGWSEVNAYLYNEEKQLELKSWPGAAMTYLTTNDYGEKIYKMDVDVSEYNRVVFNNGKSQTLNAALTVASSGFFVTSQTPKTAMQLGVYSYDTTDYGAKTTVKLSYPTGYQKPVEIWTPAGYDPADTNKKYSVIYLLDGQQQFDDSDAYNGGWGSDEVITALMKNGGEGIILVGVDNQTNRDNELTPNIGNLNPSYNYGGFKNGSGQQFADFVAKTVVPYVEANYNVYTDAAHSAIVGSSSGGIEAFYIGMEYMNEFGRIGALSPAFMLFDDSTWVDYFSKYDFTDSAKLPRIYFYNGGGDALEQELLPAAQGMKGLLSDLGYDESKMTFVYDEKNAHNESAWRNIMPEVVTWLFELQ
ncbi:MAG: alpha/beta hydrolase-fold protein [Ruminococcus sp.]|nr:alpha/beta hydrolase-fold protein [Ruminococcus sp.]